MAILTIQPLASGINEVVSTSVSGLTSQPATPLFINTSDTVATVTTTGYLNQAKNLYGNVFIDKQMAQVFTTDSGSDWYKISISGANTSLVAAEGSVTVPVVDGNFAIFNGTNGALEDGGFSPTNAAKTKVIMANAAVVANHIACFTDTAGTVDDDATTAINAGNIQAGLDATAGALVSYPATTTTGTTILQATSNSGAFNTVLTNRALGQTTTFRVPDPGASSADFLISTLTSPDNNANTIRFDVTVTAAALAAGAAVTLYASSGLKQYKIVNLWANSGGTNFSGGGGDRLLSITDNTTVYSLIPAASIQTLVNTGWGISAALPFPASAAINTSTVAGQALRAKYSGGAADYSAGSVVISGVLQRIA